MTFSKAKTKLTSIEHNLDGRMKYTYELIKPNSFKLTMVDSISGTIRHLTFDLKKINRNDIGVEFTCHGFSFNFPLKKEVKTMTFELYNFELLLIHGIKVDESLLKPEMDLAVEF